MEDTKEGSKKAGITQRKVLRKLLQQLRSGARGVRKHGRIVTAAATRRIPHTHETMMMITAVRIMITIKIARIGMMMRILRTALIC